MKLIDELNLGLTCWILMNHHVLRLSKSSKVTLGDTNIMMKYDTFSNIGHDFPMSKLDVLHVSNFSINGSLNKNYKIDDNPEA